jgi:VanZ family protein
LLKKYRKRGTEKMKSKKWAVLISILWMTMIFTATQLPYFKGANTEAVIHNTFSFTNHFDIQELNLIVRKVTHVTVFGILAVLLFKSLGSRYFFSWLLTVIYAISDEWHQSFMPGREASYKDVMLDSFGALLALSIVYLLKRRK